MTDDRGTVSGPAHDPFSPAGPTVADQALRERHDEAIAILRELWPRWHHPHVGSAGCTECAMRHRVVTLLQREDES